MSKSTTADQRKNSDIRSHSNGIKGRYTDCYKDCHTDRISGAVFGSLMTLFLPLLLSLWTVFIPLNLLAKVETLSSAEQGEIKQIEYYLALDRMHFYSTFFADHLRRQGQTEIADALMSLRPEQWAELPENLILTKDPKKLDSVMHQALRTHFPGLKFSPASISWGYNFFKTKLLEAYLFAPSKTSSPEKVGALAESGIDPEAQLVAIEKKKHPRVLMDVDIYMSEKTTRGIFWEAAVHQREIEFHLGTELDFRSRMDGSGSEIIGQIATKARNYNKIYVIRDGSDGKLKYAITRISGQDRLDHLIRQLRLVHFNGKMPHTHNQVRVFGDVKSLRAEQERNLLSILKQLPPADLTIIGQKEAIEGAIQTATKAEALDEALQMGSVPKGARNDIAEALKTMSDSYFDLIDQGSLIKNLSSEALNGEALSSRGLTIEQPSHDFSDFVFEDKEGKKQRWRIFSNVWGDEIIPIARAIDQAGTRKVIYIGTAGALPGSDFQVGDLVSPKKVLASNGKLHALNPATYAQNRVKNDGVLAQVTTPYQETESWLESVQGKAQMVELETNYLRENLSKGLPLEIYLLVSDVVGGAESLAHAAMNSSRRKSSQLNLIASIFQTEGIVRVLEHQEAPSKKEDRVRFLELVEEQFRSRDEAFKILLVEKLIQAGIRPTSTKAKAQVVALAKSTPNFGQRHITEILVLAEQELNRLRGFLGKASAFRTIYLPEEFEKGLWNPREQLHVLIRRPRLLDAAVEAKIQEAWERLSEATQGRLKFEFARSRPESGWSSIEAKEGNRVLIETYTAMALSRGFVSEITTTGEIKLKRVSQLARGSMCKELFQ